MKAKTERLVEKEQNKKEARDNYRGEGSMWRTKITVDTYEYRIKIQTDSQKA